ncbi:MAG: hypothetical protein COT34_02360 [Candidatus Nealsonbacteria bacterium CG08_land_8_20_14_0_20_43_11]|uniref:PrgI family protein n=1 Tax=Candidatus Nealsonbacteria bacterium CG08_land_8_20_14_0_20_43_11 TaxID=1974706 RepID=A0A2M6T036_9BACT|nr:MAG: hypothetical protein COT34_02360 [Candidatus Nealsonbacteria bacterium CG08_land_8_20_14_0_20_43_11]
MRFQVPQFIERESKIAGPFTFRQFLFLAGTGVIIFFLYFSFGKRNFFGFVLFSILLAGISLAFAFLNINGRSLAAILANMFSFSFSPRLYLWKKREETTPIIIEKERKGVEPALETKGLKIAEKSRLKKLSTEIETGLK